MAPHAAGLPCPKGGDTSLLNGPEGSFSSCDQIAPCCSTMLRHWRRQPPPHPHSRHAVRIACVISTDGFSAAKSAALGVCGSGYVCQCVIVACRVCPMRPLPFGPPKIYFPPI